MLFTSPNLLSEVILRYKSHTCFAVLHSVAFSFCHRPHTFALGILGPAAVVGAATARPGAAGSGVMVGSRHASCCEGSSALLRAQGGDNSLAFRAIFPLSVKTKAVQELLLSVCLLPNYNSRCTTSV